MDEFELVVKSPSQIMEARKKKFEARSSVSEGKTKISLKTSQSTPSLALVGGLLHINTPFIIAISQLLILGN